MRQQKVGMNENANKLRMRTQIPNEAERIKWSLEWSVEWKGQRKSRSRRTLPASADDRGLRLIMAPPHDLQSASKTKKLNAAKARIGGLLLKAPGDKAPQGSPQLKQP